MSLTQNIFFTGKGGVGKSSCASLFAIKKSLEGKKTLLTSLDPAHNLGDIFQKELGPEKTKLNENLWAIEVDQKKWIKKYLTAIESQMSAQFAYLTAFSLEKHLNIMQHAPAMEEHALFLAFRSIRDKHEDFDYLFFDMPPTAMSLKFFNLPELSLHWTRQLLKLRQEIRKKKEVISKIKLGKKIMEQDKVLQTLENQHRLYQEYADLFSKQESNKILVVNNPDTLAQNETKMIIARLKEINIKVFQVIMNKDKSKPDHKVLSIPKSGKTLTGYETLKQFQAHHLSGVF